MMSCESANNSLSGDTLKISFSILIVTSLLFISCGKSAPSRDFAKMPSLVKIGMTKEEVIQAIGKPDRNTGEEHDPRAQAKPGHFVFFYRESSNEMIVAFRNGTVYQADIIDVSLPL